MLDIIVTHYKEPWEIGKPFFDMLGLQRGINFDDITVTVVNDGYENRLDDNLFSGYPYKVTQIDIKHNGVSAARNAGMDCTSEPWINFCDFDDTYTNVYSLRDVLTLLPADGYDMLWGHTYSENFMDGGYGLIDTPEKSTFVFSHGKYYRREWLKKSGIRFPETIEFNEDSEFNAEIVALMDYHRIGEINSRLPLYVWCRRENSVTTGQNADDRGTYGHLIRNLKLCKVYKDNKLFDRIEGIVVRTVYDTYLSVSSKHISKTMRHICEEKFVDVIKEYEEYYVKPDNETLTEITAIASNELMDDPVPVDWDTVTKWFYNIIGKE